MAVDYLSALNVGSGLNVTQIVDALVDAEKVPQESRIQEQLDERNISISSLGDVKNDLDIFKSNLDVYKNETGLVTESTNNSAVDVTNNGKIVVQPFTHSISVNQLATSHALAFLGYTSDSDAITADTVQIELGTWNSGGSFTPDSGGTSTTITIDSTNNTLQSFAAAVNAANIGVTANVVRIDENSYALSMISPTGEARQMRVSALSGGSTVDSLSYNDTTTHASKLITAGTDADFTLDGLAVTRNTNSVDDIINGMTVELKQTTTNPVGIGASYDKEQALTNLTDFVTDLNFMINKLTEMTYRGSPGGDDAGPLADDTLVKSYLRSFKRMTTTPLPGFQEQTLYLSNFGVMTELDGSVSINETIFEEFFTANPDAFSSITNTRAVSDSNLVQAELSGSLWKTGTYEFEKSVTAAVVEVQTSSGAATASAVAEVQTASGTATASAHTIGDVYSLTVGSTTINTAASTAATDYDTVAKVATALQTAATATATAAVAEVQTASGAATASAHTIGDVYSLTVGSTTINTAASTAATDYDTVAKVAAALQTAATAASAGFSVTESGGEFVITYNTAEDQTDEAASMSFTAGTPGATFSAPTFSVTTQGADAYSAGFSVIESGGELVVTYDTAQAQTDEAVSMSFAAGTPGATFAPPTFSVTTQGAEAHTIGDVYSLTVGSTTINTAASTAATDYDTVAKVAAALQTAATAASAGFSVTESGGEFVITYNTAEDQTDEAASMSFTAGTPGATFSAPTFSVTTQGADAGPAAKLYKLDDNGARVDAGHDMSFEGGKYKIADGDARGLALTMLGNGEDAKIFIGKSLMQTIQEFTENILKPNNDIDVKIKGYNEDITEFNDDITDLTERMANQRERYMEQFTAMESSVASFKKTGDLLTNFMDSWRASLKG